ncbi:replication endonuclease [Glaesserella parasuis]|nr:replication endonuclease [Glaesserella parasuis]
MNKENWILSDSEQAEIFPPIVVAEQAPSFVHFPYSSVTSSSVVRKKPHDLHRLSMVQQDLFELDPDHHYERQAQFDKLPRQLSDYLGKLYQKRLKAYGSNYASQWFKQKMAEVLPRVKMVMSQYADVLSLWHLPYQDLSFLDGIDMPENDEKYWKAIPKEETNEQYQERVERKIRRYKVVMPDIAERVKNSKAIFSHHQLTPLCYQRPDQLEQLANTLAFTMGERQQEFGNQCVHQANNGETALALLRELYLELVEICEQYQIPAPYAKKAKKLKIGNDEVVSGLLKLACPNYWHNKLKRAAVRMKEHLAIAVGMVNINTGGYVSNERLHAHQQQRRANFEFIKNSIITNLLNDEEQVELLETWLKSNSNPKKRRIELMTRMNGFDQIAEKNGDEGVFVTLTAPSKYHAMLHEGGINPKWNGSAPHQTQKYLCSVWAKIRAELKRRGIQIYGFRVAEPHHDATPHWHLILYTRPEQVRDLKRVFWHYALEEDGDEAGAKKRRCTFKKIDRSKGSGASYLAKYISKNIDGKGMSDLLDEETGTPVNLAAERVEAWASVWRIRQFQQIGGASVGVWRECRKLGDEQQEDEVIDTLRAIADVGDWAVYTEFQGGALVLRRELKVRLHYALYGQDKYQQDRKKVNGVANQLNGTVAITRKKEWKIGRKPTNWEEMRQQKLLGYHEQAEHSEAKIGELARPWTCVSNCTGLKNNQVSQEVRERIKNELITMRGRVTDYQIDDLLNGKPLKIYSNEQIGIYVRYSRGQLIEEKRYFN